MDTKVAFNGLNVTTLVSLHFEYNYMLRFENCALTSLLHNYVQPKSEGREAINRGLPAALEGSTGLRDQVEVDKF